MASDDDSSASFSPEEQAVRDSIGLKVGQYMNRITQKEKDWWDPEEFDKVSSLVMVDLIGCLCCGEMSTGLMTCSRCKIALYCGTDCQKKDWKCRHTVCCTLLQRNNKAGVPRVLNLIAAGYVPGTEVEKEIHIRGSMSFRERLFWDVFESRPGTPKHLGLEMRVIDLFGKLRLVADATWSEDGTQMKCGYMGIRSVDAGLEAEVLLNVRPYGKLTARGRAVAMTCIEDLARVLHSHGVSVSSVTLGRGLAEEVGKEGEVYRRMKRTGCEVMTAPIIDENLVMTNA